MRLEAGGIRELHWRQNADAWQVWTSGRGRMTLLAAHSDARTIDSAPGDVGRAPATLPHSIGNAGTEDLVDLEMSEAPVYRGVSLDDRIAALPPELVGRHLGPGDETLAATPTEDFGVVPPGEA